MNEVRVRALLRVEKTLGFIIVVWIASVRGGMNVVRHDRTRINISRIRFRYRVTGGVVGNTCPFLSIICFLWNLLNGLLILEFCKF